MRPSMESHFLCHHTSLIILKNTNSIILHTGNKTTLKSPNTNTITNSKYIRYNSSNNIIEKPAFLNKFAVFYP